MSHVRKMLGFAIAAAVLLATAEVRAEDTCHGYSIGNARDRVLVHLTLPVPMHLASGECGASSADAGGNMTSECTYTDADGDRWTSRNKWVKAAAEGTWCNTEGTGKYQNLMGGCGWWKVLRRGPLNAWEFGGLCLLQPAR